MKRQKTNTPLALDLPTKKEDNKMSKMDARTTIRMRTEGVALTKTATRTIMMITIIQYQSTAKNTNLGLDSTARGDNK